MEIILEQGEKSVERSPENIATAIVTLFEEMYDLTDTSHIAELIGEKIGKKFNISPKN